jgi:DNA-binding transcriptional MocR family regulator
VLIRIDPDAATPPYEQIRVQVADQARSGTLPAGTRLPTVRRLADDLGVAPGTVARAYRELETDRVIAAGTAPLSRPAATWWRARRSRPRWTTRTGFAASVSAPTTRAVIWTRHSGSGNESGA